MKNQNEWFVWERQSRIHSLFLPLETSMEPLRKYFGQSWPTTTLIYTGNTVKWINKMKPLKELGQKMIDYYLQKTNKEKMLEDFKKEQNALEQTLSKIEKTSRKKISDSELLSLYQEFKKCYIEWFKIGWLVEPIALRSEDLLLEITKDHNKIATLTLPPEKSFSRRELEDLLEIAIEKQKGGDVKESLQEHARKYYWAHNSYFKTEVLDEKYFAKELQKLLKEYHNPTKYLGELKALDAKALSGKESLIPSLNFSKEQRDLVDLISLFGWIQDYRKEYTMQANHYLDLLLEEIGRRRKLTKTQMLYTVPRDIAKILERNFDKKELAKRMKNCLIIWKEFYDDYEILTGTKAKKESQKIFNEKTDSEIIEMQGMSANLGRRNGTAFVTFDPKEAEKMRPGNILVTSMTSPDFIVAMKNASAIVTDEGGITSHAAILAREFGIPCVVGTKIATRAIKTGDQIEVDGNHGFVRKSK